MRAIVSKLWRLICGAGNAPTYEYYIDGRFYTYDTITILPSFIENFSILVVFHRIHIVHLHRYLIIT